MMTVMIAMYSHTASSQRVDRDSVTTRIDTVEVSHEAPGVQPAGRTFSSEDIRVTPGSIGDPMRTLEMAAEAVTISDLQAIPSIGGDGADGILTLLDGFPITFPYRLFGMLSLFNPLSTSRIDVLTGGYPISHGGFAPSAIQVTSRSVDRERATIQTGLSFLASSLLFHTPLSDSLRWGVTVSARRSNVDLAAGLLSESNGDRIRSLLPKVKDVQLMFHEIPSEDLYAYQECLLTEEHGALMGVDRMFDYSWRKQFAGAAFMTFSEGWTSEHFISWTHDDISLSTEVPIEYIGSGAFGINAGFTTLRSRHQVQWPLLDDARLTIGVDGLLSRSDVSFQTFSSWLNGRSPLRSAYGDAAGFTELAWEFSDALSAVLGLRATYFGFVRETGFEPRGKLAWRIGSGSEISLSAGRYLQSPSDVSILHGFLMFIAASNQTPLMMLMSEHSASLRLVDHTLASLDFRTSIAETNALALEGRFNAYYKQTGALIMPARYPGVFTPLDTMSFEPLQSFQAEKWGAGVSSTARLVRFELSLTGSVFTHHSIIADKRTSREYRASGDIPFVAKLVLQFAPRGWEVNALYQYSTGAPTTEGYYLQATNVSGDILYLPLWKELNAARVRDYSRLDLTVAKTWRGEFWRIDIVCSVLNILNTKNISSYVYAFDAEASEFVSKVPMTNSLPLIPNVEIRYEHTL